MEITKLKEEGHYSFGAGKYTRVGGYKVFEKIEGVEIWKHEGSYYWIEDNKVSLLQKK